MDFRYCPGMCIGSKENPRALTATLRQETVFSRPERRERLRSWVTVCEHRPSAGYDHMLTTRPTNPVNLRRALPFPLSPTHTPPASKTHGKPQTILELYKVGNARSLCRGSHTESGSILSRPGITDVIRSTSLPLLPLSSPPQSLWDRHPARLLEISLPHTPLQSGHSLFSKP